MSESFIMYRSFHEALSELTREQYGNVMYAINEYALNGIEIELSGIEKAVFRMAKPQLDANEKRKTNGLKGGRPQKTNGYENCTEKKPMVIENAENEKPNVNENENVNENVKENENLTAKDSLLSPSQEVFVKIHALWVDLGLPIAESSKNYLTFLGRELKQALETWKGTRLTHSELIDAVHNYKAVADLIEDGASWMTTTGNFNFFAKHITDYLPGSFDLNKYRKNKPGAAAATKSNTLAVLAEIGAAQ